MIYKWHHLCFIFALVSSISSPILAENAYLWPLKIQPELTSKFCDYRAGHFHGGLDIRTQGRTGLACYAVDDGYVYRVNTSFRGFGKALYLKLKDGRIAVYGHLSDFGLGLDDRILKGQLQEKKFDQDLYFTASEYPVKKGQQVALSGQSGGSAPHLHLEIRSTANNPLNPLEFGYDFRDSSSPNFDELAIKYYLTGFNPANPCELEIVKVTGNSGRYSIQDTIISDNYLALSVSGGDRAGAGFLYGFYGLKLLLDDSLIFQMKSDSLSFNTTRELTYVRDLELIRMFGNQKKIDNDENIFYRLYVPPHAEQFFWGNFGDNAGIIPPDSKSGHIRKVEIVGMDENGNQSSLKFYIKSPELPELQPLSYSHNATSRIFIFQTAIKPITALVQYRKSPQNAYKNVKSSLSTKAAETDGQSTFSNTLQFMAPGVSGDYRYRVIEATGKISSWTYVHNNRPMERLAVEGSPDMLMVKYYSGLNSMAPTIMIANALREFEMQMIADGPESYKAEILGKAIAGMTKFKIKLPNVTLIDTQIVLNAVYPDKASTASSPDSTVSIAFEPGSSYYPDYIFPSNATPTTLYGNTAYTYNLEPSLFLAHAPIRFKFDVAKLGIAGKKVGVYARSAGGKWWIFIGKIDGGKLEANGYGLGELALIEDNDPPIITAVTPVGIIRTSLPTLSCSIKDEISGLALDSGINMTLDDFWVPADYDLNTSKFIYKVRNVLAAGKHKLEITALDNQGNSISKTSIFTVTKAK